MEKRDQIEKERKTKREKKRGGEEEKEEPPAARKITTKKTSLRLVDELSFSSSLGIFSRQVSFKETSFGRRFQTKESSALESIRELG